METSARSPAPAWKAAAATLARRLRLDRQAEFWRGELDRTRSLGALRARVVEVIDETHDMKTFVLRPGRRWRGHRAGQYTTIAVEIDGVRERRCYSISSPSSGPGARDFAITVKRVPGGRVSTWLHAHARPGTVLGLSPAAGDFVLPEGPGSPRLLLLSGGSGVTPMMALVAQLAAEDRLGDVVFVHHARSAADVPFRAALEALAAAHPGLSLRFCLDDAPGGAGGGGFDEARLGRLVPDRAERTTYLCGPAGLMDRVARLWQAEGLADDRLVCERFVVPGAAPSPAAADPLAPERIVSVRLAVSGRSVSAASRGSLLDQLERAGERPAHGCRIGICHTCVCRKRSGTVLNTITGELSSAPEEDIQLCVSVPRSDLELGL